MHQRIDATRTRKGGPIFYVTTISLLLSAIACAFLQKRLESAVALAAATRVAAGDEVTDEHRSNVQHGLQDAAHWEILGFVGASLAVLSWGFALWRRERHGRAWVWVAFLLSLYVVLKVIMV